MLEYDVKASALPRMEYPCIAGCITCYLCHSNRLLTHIIKVFINSWLITSMAHIDTHKCMNLDTNKQQPVTDHNRTHFLHACALHESDSDCLYIYVSRPTSGIVYFKHIRQKVFFFILYTVPTQPSTNSLLQSSHQLYLNTWSDSMFLWIACV